QVEEFSDLEEEPFAQVEELSDLEEEPFAEDSISLEEEPLAQDSISLEEEPLAQVEGLSDLEEEPLAQVEGLSDLEEEPFAQVEGLSDLEEELPQVEELPNMEEEAHEPEEFSAAEYEDSLNIEDITEMTQEDINKLLLANQNQPEEEIPDLKEKSEEEAHEPEELSAAEYEDSLNIEDIAEMTQEDINKLLLANQNQPEEEIPDLEEKSEEEAHEPEELSAAEYEGPLNIEDITEMTQEDINKLLLANQNQQIEEMPEKPVDDDFFDDMAAVLQDVGEKEEKEEAHKRSIEEKRQAKMEAKQAKKAAAQAKKQARLEEKEAAKQAKREARKAKKDKESVHQEGVEAEQQEDALQGSHELIDETEELFASLEALDNLEAENNNGIGIMEDLSAFGIDEELFGNVGGEEAALGEAAVQEETPAQKSGKKAEKKGLFAKFLDIMTEEEEEENDDSEALRLSEENEGILRELDKEEGKKKKNKKKKSGKADGADGEEIDEEDAERDKKGKKAEKKKKPKKEKPPKQTSASVKPSGKLPTKKVALIFIACFSVGAAIWVLANVGVDFSDKQAAEAAFYEGDYETCYQNLAGKTLNESQQVMYGKSESILRIRLWMREYEILSGEGLQLEALDSLIQSVYAYPKLYEFSTQYNAGPEVAEVYARILEILETEYHMSEAQAMEIASEPEDVEYTKKVKAAFAGEIGKAQPSEQEPLEALEDVLPEETDLGDVEFIEDNN
ncbi:MAG: hypothetical protein NC081_07510, partial [Roseburia sp.]|nr:hypothetical protein [Roseburia sp.]